MPQSLSVGNGNLSVNFGEKLQMQDFYFPFIGEENHIKYGEHNRVGIFVDNQISWLSEDPNWIFDIKYHTDSLVGNSIVENKKLNIKLKFEDFVYTTSNIFFRKVSIENTADYDREIKIFFHHNFHIYGDKQQETAEFDPRINGILHYRKSRYFFIGGQWDSGENLSEFSTGKANYQGFEGTFRDAEDGKLTGHPIEQGSVDSTIGFYQNFKSREKKVLFQWIVAGKNYHDITDGQARIFEITPEIILDHSRDYWKEWSNKSLPKFKNLSPEIESLYRRSLLLIRTQIDNCGAIIASTDSDIMKFNKIFIFLIIGMLAISSCRKGEPDTTWVGSEEYSTSNVLKCPYPTYVPFKLEATSFNHPETVKKIKDSSELIGYSAIDYLSNDPNEEQVLTGTVGYGSGLSIDEPIVDEYISLWFFNGTEWEQIGRTKTDNDGNYSITVPENLKFSYGTHTLYLFLEGDKTCTEQMVIIHPKGSEFVVTDIDGTLTIDDSQVIRQMSDPSYVPKSWPGAVDVMTEYANKGYYLIYLTARPNGFRAITREWLVNQGYPSGAMITASTFVHGDSAAKYKADFIQSIVDMGWKVVVAHGNAESDIQAYQKAGIPNDRIFIIGPNGGKDGSTAINSYTDFYNSFLSQFPDAQQPEE